MGVGSLQGSTQWIQMDNEWCWGRPMLQSQFCVDFKLSWFTISILHETQSSLIPGITNQTVSVRERGNDWNVDALEPPQGFLYGWHTQQYTGNTAEQPKIHIRTWVSWFGVQRLKTQGDFWVQIRNIYCPAGDCPLRASLENTAQSCRGTEFVKAKPTFYQSFNYMCRIVQAGLRHTEARST